MDQEQIQSNSASHAHIYFGFFFFFRNPNGRTTDMTDLPHWPDYDTQEQRYIRFTENVTSFTVENHYAARGVHFWNNMVPNLQKNCDNDSQSFDDDNVSSGAVIFYSIFLSSILLLLARAFLCGVSS